MTTNYNQQRNPHFLSLTANGHGAPYYALGRSTALVQQQHQQQQQQQEQQQQRNVKPMSMILPAPLLNYSHMTIHQQHQRQSTFLTAPTSSPNGEYVYVGPESPSYYNHLYQFGFLNGVFSDVTVSIPSIGQTFALHSLVICRSPYIYQQLTQLQHQRHQQQNNAKPILELDYGQVMVESFRVTFMHLYRPLSRQEIICMAKEKPRLCLELIGIAEYLGLAMLKDGLIQATLSQDYDQSSAMHWAHLLHSLSYTSRTTQSWIHTLENKLLLYLVRDLPAQLAIFCGPLVKTNTGVTIGTHHIRGVMPSKVISLPGATDLARLYSTLPWTYLTQCLKHPELPIQDTLQRYLFAQNTLRLRLSSPTTTEQGHEHIALCLQFGDNGNEQHQPSISAHSSSNNNAATELTFKKTTRRTLGKWNTSLYENESDTDGDEDL